MNYEYFIAFLINLYHINFIKLIALIIVKGMEHDK